MGLRTRMIIVVCFFWISKISTLFANRELNFGTLCLFFFSRNHQFETSGIQIKET